VLIVFDLIWFMCILINVPFVVSKAPTWIGNLATITFILGIMIAVNVLHFLNKY